MEKTCFRSVFLCFRKCKPEITIAETFVSFSWNLTETCTKSGPVPLYVYKDFRPFFIVHVSFSAWKSWEDVQSLIHCEILCKFCDYEATDLHWTLFSDIHVRLSLQPLKRALYYSSLLDLVLVRSNSIEVQHRRSILGKRNFRHAL